MKIIQQRERARAVELFMAAILGPQRRRVKHFWWAVAGGPHLPDSGKCGADAKAELDNFVYLAKPKPVGRC